MDVNEGGSFPIAGLSSHRVAMSKAEDEPTLKAPPALFSGSQQCLKSTVSEPIAEYTFFSLMLCMLPTPMDAQVEVKQQSKISKISLNLLTLWKRSTWNINFLVNPHLQQQVDFSIPVGSLRGTCRVHFFTKMRGSQLNLSLRWSMTTFCEAPNLAFLQGEAFWIILGKENPSGNFTFYGKSPFSNG